MYKAGIKMYASEREERILDYLGTHGVTPTAVLQEVTGSSIATVRRDLNALSSRGLIVKTHGAARLNRDRPAAERPIDDGREEDPFYGEKDRIAQTAARLVEDGDVIFIGAGKTCTLLARYIRGKKGLTVVTSNIDAVVELSRSQGLSMILLGGDVHVGSNYIETLDEYTIESLRRLYFDKVFLTVNGVDLEYGYSINSRLQPPLYRHLLDNSRDFYLLADRHKFGKRAFAYFCAIDRIANVVTNPETDGRYLAFYRSSGVNVYTG